MNIDNWIKCVPINVIKDPESFIVLLYSLLFLFSYAFLTKINSEIYYEVKHMKSSNYFVILFYKYK